MTDREIVTSRLLNAGPDQVFRAFSDPARLARWWGPKGFTSTFHEFDLRPGGTWRFILYGPNGASYPNESVFVEVVRSERVVLRHLSRPCFEMTITLTAESGKTRIGWRMLFETAADRDRIAKFSVDANEQNLDRLEAELARPARGGVDDDPHGIRQAAGRELRGAHGAHRGRASRRHRRTGR